MSQNLASQNAVSQNVASQNAASQKAVSKNGASQNAASHLRLYYLLIGISSKNEKSLPMPLKMKVDSSN